MKKHLFFLLVVMMVTIVAQSAVTERKGWWKFNDPSDMLKAEIGSPLVLTGTQTSVSGPAAGNLATQIGLGSFLTMTHGISANGGGTLVNEYSLQFDISMPEGALWHAIYQTIADNSDDAELFINTDNFLGAWRFGYSTNPIAPNTWYRVIVSVKNGEFFKIYVNGELWVDGAGQTVDDRDALQSVLLLFADNDGEDNTMICSETGIWDVALTAAEALELGDATTSTGEEPTLPARAGLWKFDNAQDLLAAEIGLPLELTGNQESVSGPVDGNLATQIGLGSFLSMTHGIAPNLGGAYVNEFTIQIDFSVPAVGTWHSFIQTNPANENDADLFTNTSNSIGVGDLGYSTNTILANTWYRMIVSVKNGEFFKIYINGELWLDGAGQPIDGRYGIEPVLVIFGDNDGDDGIIACSELAIWDVSLTGEQAAQLGDASTFTGILEPEKFAQTSDLGQNFPNPFGSVTTFPYEVTETGMVNFTVLDLSGRQLNTINQGVQAPGQYQLKLNADMLSNGIYYVRMTVNNRISTRKIAIFK